jgi:hypothetical protein
MMSLFNRRSVLLNIQASKLLALSAAALLGACTVQTRVYTPPPPRVYVAAPAVTAEVAAPGVELAVTASEPPPPLPVYTQPPCPEDGYLWTPGYWHYGSAGYFWVPGTWVQPPRAGVLWTPGYWGFNGGVYGFHAGYWGPHIGFYGGVNYGFGFGGVGFVGGRWDGGHFAYNTAVNNVSTTNIHNTYNQTVINNVTINKVSYNGGAGGVAAVPTAQERAAAQEPHVAPTPAQTAHIQEASRNPALSARANGGHPAIAATARPGAFTGPGVVGARGAVAPAAKSPAMAQAQPKSAALPNAAPGAPKNQAPKNAAPPAANAKAPAAKPKPQVLAAKPQAQKPHPKDSEQDKKHEAEDGGKAH